MSKKVFSFIVVAFLSCLMGFPGIVAGAELAYKEQASAKTCKACYEMCEQKLDYLLKKGDKYASPQLIQLMRDCITICKANEDFKRRGSANAALLAKTCADICLQCGKACEDLKDDTLKDCVAMCYKCADCCSNVNQAKSTSSGCSKDDCCAQ